MLKENLLRLNKKQESQWDLIVIQYFRLKFCNLSYENYKNIKKYYCKNEWNDMSIYEIYVQIKDIINVIEN